MRPVLTALAFCVFAGLPIVAQAQVSLSDGLNSVDQQETPTSFAALSRRLMPAVVNITTQQTIAPQGLPQFPNGDPLEQFNEFFGRDPEGFSQQGSLGSGFVISADGLIVTNNHVIEGADEINAIFSDGRTVRAILVGTDIPTDIAVLKVDLDEALPFVEFADSDKAEVGDWVMAIGNPFGFGGSVSVGIVSARNRDIQSGNYDDYIQTDAAINRGNSGGPLFNLNGEVLGVNTAIISPTGGSVGLGFSIPSNLVKQISGQLIEFGSARRGWFGVNVQAVDTGLAQAYGLNGDDGVIITRVDPNGPAARSDIEVGDLILQFDGKSVDGVRGLSRVVAETEIGKTVEIAMIRDGQARTVSLELGELESSDPDEETTPVVVESSLTDNPMGVDLTELNDTDRRRYGISSDIDGVLVRSVSPKGSSFGKLQKGDVVIEMAFEPVATPTEALVAMDKAARRSGTPLLVRIYRGQGTMFFSIDLAARG